MYVVNVKKAELNRRGYKDVKHWIETEGNLYVGRGIRVFVDKKVYYIPGSKFANPWKIGVDGDLSQVLNKYQEYIMKQMTDEDASLILSKREIGCWCVDNNCNNYICCHAQILQQIAIRKLMSQFILKLLYNG